VDGQVKEWVWAARGLFGDEIFIYCKHSYIFQCIYIIFRESYPSTLLKLQKSLRLILIKIRLPEDDGDAMKHVGVLMIYKILLTYICCTFAGLDNKLYKMYGIYIQIVLFTVNVMIS